MSRRSVALFFLTAAVLTPLVKNRVCNAIYTSEHCAEDGCDMFVMEGSRYCMNHICDFDSCMEGAECESGYCLEHDLLRQGLCNTSVTADVTDFQKYMGDLESYIGDTHIDRIPAKEQYIYKVHLENNSDCYITGVTLFVEFYEQDGRRVIYDYITGSNLDKGKSYDEYFVVSAMGHDLAYATITVYNIQGID